MNSPFKEGKMSLKKLIAIVLQVKANLTTLILRSPLTLHVNIYPCIVRN